MNKKYLFTALFALLLGGNLFSAVAQNNDTKPVDEKYLENDVVSLAGKEGFTFRTAAGDFLFKPYGLVQTTATFNYFDDQGLESLYAPNIANSGFAIPNAILGFTGKAFGKVTFNLALNPAKSGGALLQQAWCDVALKDSFRVRVGKFKTPFMHAYLTTLGETLFPVLPTSAMAPILLPYDLNDVRPSMATGFDLGVQLHGVLDHQFLYQVGVFNGSGISINNATKGMAYDHKWLPQLLYAGRIAYMPKGEMPATQGNPSHLREDKMLFGLSTSYNVEAQNHSSSNWRVGAEFAMIKNRFYLAAEAYYMGMHFTRVMAKSKPENYWGAYAQAGYFVTPTLQAAVRYDVFDRNGMAEGGWLNMPALGVNYFMVGSNLKLQVMYQYLGRMGHATQMDRDNDGIGLARHCATALLQYTF